MLNLSFDESKATEVAAFLLRHLLQQHGWKLQIVKRRQREFKITGLTWIVERSFAAIDA
jgi:hypothetical protein